MENIYKVEVFEETWREHSTFTALSAADEYFRNMVRIHPSKEWRIIQERLIKDIWSHHKPL